MSGVADDLDWHCYVHPDREAGVRCTRCDRAICPDCMVTAPVGFQCRGCVRAAPQPRVIRFRAGGPASWQSVTGLLIGACLVLYVVCVGQPEVRLDLGLFGPLVAEGEWWRLLTAGFVHANLLHAGFNCLLLWQIGSALEGLLGRVRLLLLALAALLGGSLGALILEPEALTIGASGMVFGFMGAMVVVMRGRGVDPMASGLGGLLAMNLVITFVLPGISVGGHLGGLAAGALSGWVLDRFDGNVGNRRVGAVAVVALAVALAGAGISVAA